MFLHQTTTNVVPWSKQGWLYIIMFLHQTTTVASQLSASASCILSCSYIKPQLYAYSLRFPRVVYYHVPTSNHNQTLIVHNIYRLYIIMFLHQTTTVTAMSFQFLSLYIIMFLHQTTTAKFSTISAPMLYIIMFLHQTTT